MTGASPVTTIDEYAWQATSIVVTGLAPVMLLTKSIHEFVGFSPPIFNSSLFSLYIPQIICVYYS